MGSESLRLIHGPPHHLEKHLTAHDGFSISLLSEASQSLIKWKASNNGRSHYNLSDKPDKVRFFRRHHPPPRETKPALPPDVPPGSSVFRPPQTHRRSFIGADCFLSVSEAQLAEFQTLTAEDYFDVSASRLGTDRSFIPSQWRVRERISTFSATLEHLNSDHLTNKAGLRTWQSTTKSAFARFVALISCTDGRQGDETQG